LNAERGGGRSFSRGRWGSPNRATRESRTAPRERLAGDRMSLGRAIVRGKRPSFVEYRRRPHRDQSFGDNKLPFRHRPTLFAPIQLAYQDVGLVGVGSIERYISAAGQADAGLFERVERPLQRAAARSDIFSDDRFGGSPVTVTEPKVTVVIFVESADARGFERTVPTFVEA
jgi:hypothetical protein